MISFLLSAANIESVGVLKHTLNEFGQLSGLIPNLQKSSSIFMAGVSSGVQTNICNLMGMEMKVLPVKYLGVPLISSRLRYDDCVVLKERILRRVTSWHAKVLSYAGGRVQLIISVLASIQSY